MQGAEIVNLCLELQDSIHEKDQHGKPAYLEKGYVLVPRFVFSSLPHLNQYDTDKYFERIAFGSFDAMSWYDSLINSFTITSSIST